MRIFDGTVYRDMTPEELAAHKREAMMVAVAEARRPMSAEEVSRMVITAQINTLTVDDNTALRMVEFYPEWMPGVSCDVGYKTKRNGKLWKCLQAHTAQPGWEPENAASLWTEICEVHSGTEEDPIPYNGNMELMEGLYYYQNYALHRCIRSTGQPVHQPLAELAGLYTEPV